MQLQQNTTYSKKITYRAQLGPVYMGENGSTYMCEKCLTKHKEETKRMEQIVYTCGAEFYHYSSDDGYGTERAECLTQLEIR
jgi:hypothetical protein